MCASLVGGTVRLNVDTFPLPVKIFLVDPGLPVPVPPGPVGPVAPLGPCGPCGPPDGPDGPVGPIFGTTASTH
ncbi:MAG: hypothetical protein FJ187_06365 [Gammaproteobacteria bacterium]|nr:hypothetical protein [Gammaproteobacteria bacterium]